MTRIPELLVPAGGMEQLKAAVVCGADAVYLGGASFSARAHADNFTEEELQEAVDYAHTYGVSVHVAMNTLLTNEELPQALRFAAKAYRCRVDAVIVQDQGLFDQIHQVLPELSLHLSTQGTAIDSSGVKYVADRGASRVILARELSLHEIREICRRKGETEIEIFVHGAICIGLSGQCHLSGTIGGRSGNRGDCAQPCRMNYTLMNSFGGDACSGYHLSPKDMCLLGHLEEIAEAGVDSIKIEGRMKSPEYVAAVTSIYRKHLDRIKEGNTEANQKDLEADLAVLRQVYSRGTFTDTYLKGSAGQELMSGSSPKHQGIYIGKMQSFQKKNGHAVIDLIAPLSVGDGVEIVGRKGTADNVVTYIKAGRSGVQKKAEPGMTVEIGDLRLRKGMPEKGAQVYRLRSKELSQNLKQQIGEVVPRLPVELSLTAEEGKSLYLEGRVTVGDQLFTMTAESEEILEPARSGAVDTEKLKERLTRTGGTPYFCSEAVIHTAGSPFVPVSLMNDLRRQVLSGLTERRKTEGYPSEEEGRAAEERCRLVAEELQSNRNAQNSKGGESEAAISTEGVQLYFHEVRDLEKKIHELLERQESQGSLQKTKRNLIFCLPLAFFIERAEASGIRFEEQTNLKASVEADQEKQPEISLEEAIPIIGEIEQADCEFDIVLPLELGRTSLQRKAEHLLNKLCEMKSFRAVMMTNPGQLSLIRAAGCEFETDLTMNVLNREAASSWLGEGARSVCVSEEPDFLLPLGKASIDPKWCIPVYGRLPVMYLEHCPIGSHKAKIWHPEGSGSKGNRNGSGKKEPCCSRKKRQFYCRRDSWSLEDRTGAQFPVKADSKSCRAVIFSHDRRDRTDEISGLRKRGVALFRISILEESAETIFRLLQRIK